MTLLKRMFHRYENRMIRVGRERARAILLSRSDRTLADLGFSRHLLESGVGAWPWDASAEKLAEIDFDSILANDKQAIEELQALTDNELHDLGISRGTIHESVILGRPGIEYEPEREAA